MPELPDAVHATPPGEPTAVTLARMEGKVDMITYQMGELVPRVRDLEQTKFEHETKIQSIQQSMEAEARTRVTLAAALKDADEARRAKSDDTWTPFQRIFASLAGLVALLVLAEQLGYIGG